VSNHENSSCGITPSKHVARIVVVIMTEALGENFSLDEFETSVIENVDKQLSFKLVRAMEMISDAV
jgi:hypothetical protein